MAPSFTAAQSVEASRTRHVSAVLLTIIKAFRDGADNAYDSIVLSGEISLLVVVLSPSVA